MPKIDKAQTFRLYVCRQTNETHH